MRNLLTNSITNSIGFPVKGGTLEHLQAAYKEAIAEAIKGLVGSSYSAGTMYILQGLVNSGDTTNWNISGGSVFFNGEVCLVDAAVFTSGATQTAVCKVVTTYFTGPNADGVQFTDGIVRNVHEIRKVVISADFGGSGISNYINGVRINTNIPQVNIQAGSGIGVSGVYPNITVANTSPNTNRVRGWGYLFIGDLNQSGTLDPGITLMAGSTNGLSAYRYNFPAVLPDANYLPQGTLGNNGHSDWGGFNDNFMCTLQIGGYDAAGFYFAIGTTASSNAQSLAVKYMLVDTR